jgi:voltage-gated potassium channel
MARDKVKELRRRVYPVLEQGSVGDALSLWVDRFLVGLILVNLVVVADCTSPS